jgi:hypothetical protein
LKTARTFLLCLTAAASGAVPSLLADSLAEIQSHWSAYCQSLLNFKGKIIKSSTGQGPEGLRWSARVTLIAGDGFMLCVDGSERNGEESQRAQGSNRAYLFEIARTGSDKPWVLVKYSGNTGGTGSFVGDLRDVFDCHLNTGLSLLSPREWLPFLVKDSEFAITKIEPAEVDGKKLLRLDFLTSPRVVPSTVINDRNLPSGRVLLQSGTIWLNPENHFLIHSFSVIRPEGKKTKVAVRGSYSYGATKEGVPIVTKIRRIVSQAPDTAEYVNEDLYEYFESNPEASEVSLAAFGLPEPGKVEGATPLYRYFVVGACLSLGLTVLIRRYRRTAKTLPLK